MAEKYKIIGVCNYNRENVSDILVIGPWLSHKAAQEIADILNQESGEDSPRFYKAVTADHALYKFEP